MSAKVIEIEKIEGKTRTWYQISGTDLGTGLSLEGQYALCADGRVLDQDGYQLTAGGRESIAVKNLI